MDRDRRVYSSDGIADDQDRTEKKERRQDDTTVKRGFSVVVFTLFFKEICDTYAYSVTEIMQSIRKDGGTAGYDTAKAFKNGKCQIQQECDQNITFCFHKGPPLDQMIIYGTINSIMNIMFGFML
jgi:hypothetical protein